MKPSACNRVIIMQSIHRHAIKPSACNLTFALLTSIAMIVSTVYSMYIHVQL